MEASRSRRASPRQNCRPPWTRWRRPSRGCDELGGGGGGLPGVCRRAAEGAAEIGFSGGRNVGRVLVDDRRV
ncbi:hypothetical protein Cni_G13310 [Canna indica]|uniref:Uncharacterized protein n=1 Tax=Canna indica TaxID=4628 RepID=A0AAQ3QBE2_9LILI|nr:hypothetical protein Cni_G13310 [Canna indica]